MSFDRPRTRLIIPALLACSMAAVGFVPPTSCCGLLSGTAQGNQMSCCSSGAATTSLAGGARSSTRRSCCSGHAGRSCCGPVCHCAVQNHRDPISTPLPGSASDHAPEVLAVSLQSKIAYDAPMIGWDRDISLCISSSLQAPTLQHQHVRIQT